ncbi:MAG: preprotein translocase subunit SecG [Treponema sp.]|nr:preprotein translocase subunit SecG [Treponema sp.]
MSAIGVILLVAFVIVCVLLVLLVLVQDDGQNGMGGLLGGRGTAAFGSHSASVLTKTTTVLVVLFFGITVVLALLNKKPSVEEDLAPTTSVEAPAESAAEGESSEANNSDATWWNEAEKAE